MQTTVTTRIGPWDWTIWPTMALPTAQWLAEQGAKQGPSWLHEFHARREKAIANEQRDPLAFGWEQPPMKLIRSLLTGTYQPGTMGRACVTDWKQTETANDILVLGGNGSGKTESLAKLAMELLTAEPNMELRCFSQNEQTSVRYIQRSMFRYMPPHLRPIKRQGQTTKISYQESTGFSENIFVLPNSSTALFPTYKGWEQDRKSVEGGECNGITWDEEAPAELLDTIRFRSHKTGGWVLGGFTPVGGYTETVGQYIEGATILETIPARMVKWNWWTRSWEWGEWLLPQDRELVRGCPAGHVPLVLQSGAGRGRRFVVVFPTPFNPYTNVQAIVDGTRGSPVDFMLERLFGWPTKLARKAFPNYCSWHEVEPERVPPLDTMTIYHLADPHGQRNWFMIWIGVTDNNDVFVFHEWPDDSMGEWALPGSKPDGKAGPGQHYGGNKSFNDYKRIIMEIEGWVRDADGTWKPGPNAWKIFSREMDPRPAGTSVPSDEDSLNYIDHMARPIMEGEKRVADGLDFCAAPACGIEEGTQLVGDWLTAGWNHREEVTPMNCPKFYVSKKCANVRWALRTWTGTDGDKGACKDPVDVLKLAAKRPLQHMASGELGSHGGSFGY